MSPLSDIDIQLRLKGQDDALARIEKSGNDTLGQLTKLNGQVQALSRWKERTTGAAWAFGVCMVLLVIPLAAWTLYNQSMEPQRIQKAVASYFSDNYSQVRITNP